MSTVETSEPAVRSGNRTRQRSGRIFVVVLLIIALFATAYTRDLVISDHEKIRSNGRVIADTSGGGVSLSSMPSFATALLLGGLRGPLVMILWTSSENQKQQHDLQDFDTKVEWIRLLQPEFDTVHLFQIWNKAYNISVQMASLRNKYITILDAIDYGQKVEKERPDDINIITAVAMLYGDKLGTSQEHVYYRARIRRESQTLTRITFPAARTEEFKTLATKAGWSEKDSPLLTNDRTQMVQVVVEPMIVRELKKVFSGSGIEYLSETRRESQQNDPTWRRVRLDPIADENGNVLPSLIAPRYPRPADVPETQPWYDGSQMQFLKQYEPFPYGVSTLGLAYNDYKRAQLLQDLWNQHHIQTGDTVVDVRPALTLKTWAQDEWERGRRSELRMRDEFISEGVDPIELEIPTASNPFDKPIVDRGAYDEALYSYALSSRLFHNSMEEFRVHIDKYKSFASVYFVHVDDAFSGEHIMKADHDYLAAMTATGTERTALLKSAAANYYTAMQHFAVTILKYYVDEPVVAIAFPKDPKTGQQYSRTTIEASDPDTYLRTLQAVEIVNARFFADPVTHQYSQMRDTFHDDRENYKTYISHCAARLDQLQTLLGTKP